VRGSLTHTLSRPPSSYSARSTQSDKSDRTETSSLQQAQVLTSSNTRKHNKPFESQLLVEGTEIEKPWLLVPDPRVRVSWWITVVIALLGVLLSGALIYFGAKGVPNVGNVCLILDEQWENGLDSSIWTREVNMDGFGNGEFEMTTNADNNSYVENGILYILPTLTSEVIGQAAVFDGYTYNISDCSYANTLHNLTSCSAISNATKGTVINPIMSARIHTRNSKWIKYGRVEIKAKMPRGDWMWPALWMLPVNNTYGPWPASGEIDIVELRGNDMSYPARGDNYAISTLNWGPTPDLNLAWTTSDALFQRRSTYGDAFHTFTLEWDRNFIWTYVDNRLDRMIDVRITQSFWDRGNFPPTVQNGTETILLENPWASGDISAPFDQPFYLIMNVAVGGTNGWFPDNVANKPWLDGSQTAMRDFARAQDSWYSTWPSNIADRAMQVESVKMWQKC